MINYKRYKTLMAVLSTSLLISCSSTDDSVEPLDNDIGASASPDESSRPKKEEKKPLTRGPMALVTTPFMDRGDLLEKKVSDSLLTNVITESTKIAEREPENIPLLVTMMGLLRIYKNDPHQHVSIQKKAGMNGGGKDPWFAIEAALSSLQYRKYSYADYFLVQAKKLGKNDGTINSAVEHIQGIKLLMERKKQAGLFKIRSSAKNNFLPSLLTLGFLALEGGDYAGGEYFFRQAAAQTPTSVHVRLGLAAALRTQGKTSEAIEALTGVYRTHSKDRRVVWNYALALADGNGASKTKAVQILEQYFQLPGHFPNIDSKATNLLNSLKYEMSKNQQPAAKKP